MKKNTAFRLVFKGYEPQAVDQALAGYAEKLEEQEKELNFLRDNLRDTQEKLREAEGQRELIEETLVSASVMADHIIGDARKRAEEIIEKSKEEDMTRMQELRQEKEALESTVKRVEYILKSQLALVAKAKDKFSESAPAPTQKSK